MKDIQVIHEVPKAVSIDECVDKIFCGNCVEILRSLPSDSIDLIVTSPPYGDVRTYTNEYQATGFDFEGTAFQLKRVIKPGGVMVWVVDDTVINRGESGESLRQALFFMDRCGLNKHDTMIYNKNNFAFPSTIQQKRYHQAFEYMFVFSKGVPTTFNPISDREIEDTEAWGKKTERQADGSLKESNRRSTSNEKGRRLNVWDIKNGGIYTSPLYKEAKQHPARFPEELAEDHIITWSNDKEIVLDPLSGSGTTCAMAARNNRHFIGIEISPEYCELSRQRINNMISKGKKN
ncbi:MAG: site-specific DNA-methyltransferase [Nitrospirae bacterium]|nr:site-specific DNA-methyltransferase [Nitrospirota bacterium]